GLVVIVVMVFAAVFAPLVTSYSPSALGDASLAKPSLKHWFGTDVLGRDLFTRVVYGARVSLKIGILAVLIASSIGLVIGAVTGLGAGVTEPTPACGFMVAAGRSYLFTAPHLLFFPAAAILLTVMAFVFVGDGLRDALDPRLR